MRKGFEKRFNQGDIVYWCHYNGAKYTVKWGMVDEQFSDAVHIDYLALRERRKVDGVPIDEFQSEQRYRKLPKGWSYDTKLFELTIEDLTEEEKEYVLDATEPECVKEAYEKGYLVKDETIFHGVIDSEITKDGFRVVKKTPMWGHHISNTSVRPDKVYFTFEEAKKEVDENIAELHRQANLTDYEWSVEQIDKTLNIYKCLWGLTEEKEKEYKDWLLGMENVEEIEVRISGGNLQWKYWDKKKWHNLEV